MLTKKEKLIARLQKQMPKMCGEDRKASAGLLMAYLRNHELTGPQWRLAKKLADNVGWYEADLAIAAEADKHI